MQHKSELYIRFDFDGPLLLSDAIASLQSIESQVNSLIASESTTDQENRPRATISEIKSGSLEYVIGVVVPFFGQIYTIADQTIKFYEIAEKIRKAIKTFSGDSKAEIAPTEQNVALFKDFLKPIIGKKNTSLKVRAARFSSKDGDKETKIEYIFEEAELSRAANNLLSERPALLTIESPDEPKGQSYIREALFVWDQANRKRGKAKGKTGDRGIIEKVSAKSLPVYFPEISQTIKQTMVHGQSNPFKKGFIIDAHIQTVGNEPKLIVIDNLHQVIDLD